MRSQHDALAGPLTVFVATGDGYTAGRIRESLDREGFQMEIEWGRLDELSRRSRAHIDLVIVVEGEWEITDDETLLDARDAVPHARFVVICSPQRDRLQTLLWHGVEGVVVEPGADAVVGPIARAVLGGYLAAPEELRMAVDLPPLSARDRELLDLVVDGLTNREIAQRLYLAESTVKRHLSNLFRRLGVKSRNEAASAALAAGAIDQAERRRRSRNEIRNSSEERAARSAP